MNDIDKPDIESEFLYNLNKFRQTNFFFNLPPEAVKVIAFLCSREEYQEGEYLFHQNDDDGTAYYIMSGTATLTRCINGKDEAVKTYGRDDFIGGLSLVAHMPRQFSLVASDGLTCLVMTRKKFVRVLDQFPGVALQIITALGEKVLNTEKAIIHDIESHGKEIKNLLGISLI